MIDDKKLLDLLCNASKKDEAFKLLLDTYQERLYWHIRKLVLHHEDANDVLQNTFIKIYKNIAGFKQASSLNTWMYKIAYNESMTLIANNKKKLFVVSEEANQRILDNLEEDVFFEGTEIQLKFQEALLRLPEKQRQVFQMKYFDDLKFREIAEVTGTSEGGLKASYHIAVKKLETFLKNA